VTRWARLLVAAGLFAAGARGEPAEELVRLLASEDAEQRERAETALRESVPGDAVAVRGVTGLLAHKNPAVRLAAARLLGRLAVADGLGVRGRESRRKGPSRLHGSASEKAVHAALDWLARFQDPATGRWSPDGFVKRAEGAAIDGAGNPRYEVGVSALALLAFLGAGYTDRGDGRHRDTVKAGLTCLVGRQAYNGCLGPEDLARRSTNHAVAAMALCEAWILTGDPMYRRHAQDAVSFLERSRAPGKAWGYVHDEHTAPDSHTTGWVLSTLGIARRAGLTVDESGLRVGLDWFAAVEEPEFGVVGYESKGVPISYGGFRTVREATPLKDLTLTRRQPLAGTRAGLFLDPDRHAPSYGAHSLAIWSRILVDPGREETKGLAESDDHPPRWRDGEVDPCMWAYAALALAQLDRPEAARTPTVDWFESLHDAVLGKQRTDGAACGSWDPVDAWADAGGRIYATAMIARALQAPYLYGLSRDTPTAARSAAAALRRVAADAKEDAAVREAAAGSLASIDGRW
jgi:hypothetical protein